MYGSNARDTAKEGRVEGGECGRDWGRHVLRTGSGRGVTRVDQLLLKLYPAPDELI